MSGPVRMSIHIGAGPFAVAATGRSVYFMWVTLALLAVGGVLVLVSRQAELRRRWLSWAVIVPAVGLPMWLGRGATAVLAGALAFVGVREFAKLVSLPRVERALLEFLAVAYPVAAWLQPSLLDFATLIAISCALPAILAGDSADGFRRAALTMFGSIWLCWALANLVVLWHDAFLLCSATAVADIGAWCGGAWLRRLKWARRQLSPLSPNKTLGGLVGGLAGAALAVGVLAPFSVGLALVVGLGAPAGDLLESMVKRHAGVKDAGTWLPGFGGLLDRIDSLLVVLPLAAAVLI
jgi:phosphatidate cytidylyltransferase